MEETYLEKLEFYKILKILTNFCYTNQGKQLVYNLRPNYNRIEVEKLLNETRRSYKYHFSKFFSFFL